MSDCVEVVRGGLQIYRCGCGLQVLTIDFVLSGRVAIGGGGASSSSSSGVGGPDVSTGFGGTCNIQWSFNFGCFFTNTKLSTKLRAHTTAGQSL